MRIKINNLLTKKMPAPKATTNSAAPPPGVKKPAADAKEKSVAKQAGNKSKQSTLPAATTGTTAAASSSSKNVKKNKKNDKKNTTSNKKPVLGEDDAAAFLTTERERQELLLRGQSKKSDNKNLGSARDSIYLRSALPEGFLTKYLDSENERRIKNPQEPPLCPKTARIRIGSAMFDAAAQTCRKGTGDSCGTSTIAGVDFPVSFFGTYKLSPEQLAPLVTSDVEPAKKKTNAVASSSILCNSSSGGIFQGVDTAVIYGNEKALKAVGAAASAKAMQDVEEGRSKGREQEGFKVAPYNRAETDASKREHTVKVYRKPMEHLFLQTKQWQSKHGYKGTMDSFNESCKSLGLLEKAGKGQWVQRAPLGCYLIHHPGCKSGWPLKRGETLPKDWQGTLTRRETWRAMEDLWIDGRVEVIGVCNFSERQLQEITEGALIPPMVNQFECHPLLPQDKLRAFCREQGILVQAFASLGGSDRVSKDAQNSLTLHATVKEVAKSAKKTPAQVLFRWALQKDCMVLPKSQNPERMRENADLFQWTLTAAEMAKLDSIGKSGTQRLTWKGVDPDTIA
ncbi:unnamed protein product [Amoebophrya sp. A120]|nr:unnamed protein product [Amoebophrya sp. A120]|eukprot:GSA120T00000997001.1